MILYLLGHPLFTFPASMLINKLGTGYVNLYIFYIIYIFKNYNLNKKFKNLALGSGLSLICAIMRCFINEVNEDNAILLLIIA